MDSAPSFQQAPLPSSPFTTSFNINLPTAIDPRSQAYWLDTISMASRPPQEDFVPQFPSAASAPTIAAVSASTPTPTPKPSKRKRLAKACDACHRSKRRCDGTSPCGNCAFADKPCTYTDTSGRPVAPPNPTPAHRQSNSSQGWASSGSSFDANVQYQPPTPVPTTSDPGVSLVDPGTLVHLVNIFFARCHPSSLLFHRPTFMHELARARIPSYLLLCVCALAAPFSNHPTLRRAQEPHWHRGDNFAAEAIKIIFNESAASNGLSDSLDSLRIRPSLELAQALCLLQVHDCVMRRGGKSDKYLVYAITVLKYLDVMHLDMPSNNVVEGYTGHVKTEAMRRTLWYIYCIEVLSSAFTNRPLSIQRADLNGLRLPIEEALFELPRIENRPGHEIQYEYLPLPSDGHPCKSEFANLLRVSTIYAGVMNALVEKHQMIAAWENGQISSASPPDVSEFEQNLRAWLETLPEHLYLSEPNIEFHVSQLESGAGAGSWCFAYMHALAECTVLALHEYALLGSESKDASDGERERKALENLCMILRSLGERGRANIMMATLLLAVGKHRHTQNHEVLQWFTNFQLTWGVSLDQLMDVRFRASWCSASQSPSPPSTNSSVARIDAGTRAAIASSYGSGSFGSDGMSRKRKYSDSNVDLSFDFIDGPAMGGPGRDDPHRTHIAQHPHLYSVEHDVSDTHAGHTSAQSFAPIGISDMAASLPRGETSPNGLDALASVVTNLQSQPSTTMAPQAIPASHHIHSQPIMYANMSQAQPIRVSREHLPGVSTVGLMGGRVGPTAFGHLYPHFNHISIGSRTTVSEEDDSGSGGGSPMFHLGSLGQRSYERGAGYPIDPHRQPMPNGMHLGHATHSAAHLA